MRVLISTKIEKEDRERIRALVSKGMFTSMSDFYRTAMHRFLKEIDEYQEKKKQVLKESMGVKQVAQDAKTDDEDLEELRKFVDDLY